MRVTVQCMQRWCTCVYLRLLHLRLQHVCCCYSRGSHTAGVTNGLHYDYQTVSGCKMEVIVKTSWVCSAVGICSIRMSGGDSLLVHCWVALPQAYCHCHAARSICHDASSLVGGGEGGV